MKNYSKASLIIALTVFSISASGGAKQEYELCLSKLDAAERHVKNMKLEHSGNCHYFYMSCSRRYWNGHPKPLIAPVDFVVPTIAHNRANAVAVKIGNQCMGLLDAMEEES